ncbi:hypothetical protein MtrunA17_Chr3g0081021 [Medicago truncatula]|uniref:Uncharacterized protein n=1 Tax=Medicago truncatula TaxID=3880 RepID=A0A396IMH6_MEDTR|nr:hypothetical protein MtrunA17_Chr3g0081021 [Medicago truncatula]
MLNICVPNINGVCDPICIKPFIKTLASLSNSPALVKFCATSNIGILGLIVRLPKKFLFEYLRRQKGYHKIADALLGQCCLSNLLEF